MTSVIGNHVSHKFPKISNIRCLLLCVIPPCLVFLIFVAVANFLAQFFIYFVVGLKGGISYTPLATLLTPNFDCFLVSPLLFFSLSFEFYQLAFASLFFPFSFKVCWLASPIFIKISRSLSLVTKGLSFSLFFGMPVVFVGVPFFFLNVHFSF